MLGCIPSQFLSNFIVYISHLGFLLNTDSKLVVRKKALRLYISKKLPGDADSAGQWAIFWVLTEYTFYMRLNEGGFLPGRELGKGKWWRKGSEAEIRCVYQQQIEVIGEEVEKAGCEISTVPAQINVVSTIGKSVLSQLKTQTLSLGSCGCCLVPTSCLTPLPPMDCSLPGPSVHFPGKNTGVNRFLLQGILPTRDRTHVSWVGRQICYHWGTGEAHP